MTDAKYSLYIASPETICLRESLRGAYASLRFTWFLVYHLKFHDAVIPVAVIPAAVTPVAVVPAALNACGRGSCDRECLRP